MGCALGSPWSSFRRDEADSDTTAADSPKREVSPHREKWPPSGTGSIEYVVGTSMAKIITPDHSRRNTLEGSSAPAPLLFFPGDMQSPADYREESSKEKGPSRSASSGSQGGFETPGSRADSTGKENNGKEGMARFSAFVEAPALSSSPSRKAPSVAQGYVDTLRKRRQEELQRSQESKLAKVAGAEELIKQSLTTPFAGLSLREPRSPEE